MSSPTPAVSAEAAAAAKVFSLDEANRALPYVSRVAVDIAEVYAQVIELRAELEGLDDGELRTLTEREYETTMDRLGGLVDELHLTGAELRDFERGRVEFPGRLGHRRIMLSWEAGAAAVTGWHDAEADDDTLHPVADLIGADAA
ncbi:MAG: DUF2203 family protein [Planctomycetota bacterium]